MMTKPLKIDFVSDVMCPWCAVGLGSLERALAKLGDEVEAEIRFHPFELNPAMPKGGQDLFEHLGQKYGLSKDQILVNQERLRERAAESGFVMARDEKSRMYNSFDAHRLLHWAGLEGGQAALKHALLGAYFSCGENVEDHEVLAGAAEVAGLDREAAREVLASGRYAEEVRAEERDWLEKGINSVPAVVIADRYLISGGQPAEAFEQAIRQIVAKG
ncbi:MAG TPA: DsbA family oxidoreductase [Magnetospirillaceae bacterium]|nr:DsbA family oxidoreductase [Magnetospirillaceae bacterium]